MLSLRAVQEAKNFVSFERLVTCIKLMYRWRIKSQLMSQLMPLRAGANVGGFVGNTAGQSKPHLSPGSISSVSSKCCVIL